MKGAYYNEIDPYAAQWLRNLIAAGHIAAGHIAAGDVDERSIVDVQPADLRSYAQCHFFAGIGGWSYALRLAGWPDDEPVWTGSCPCQPLSGAGQRKGHADERHLWPAFHGLIAERRPATVFGEQVASSDGREWLAGVRADLEAVGYAVGAADLCAAGLGAPHIRQRLYWLADAGHERTGRPARPGEAQGGRAFGNASRCGDASAVADTYDARLEGRTGAAERAGERTARPHGLAGGMEHPGGDGRRARRRDHRGDERPIVNAACAPGFWSAYDLIPCTDGKARRVEPGSFPLAHGIPNRVGRLRAYGNAIVPQVAAAFIEAAIG